MDRSDEISLTLPREREFQLVAHLVLGGLALRHDLTIETLEDLQLALGAVLDRVGADGEVTVTLCVRDGALQARVAPVDIGTELDRADDGTELSLHRVLWTVVDDVDVESDRVTLTKNLHAAEVTHG
jgi:hypothetical protein